MIVRYPTLHLSSTQRFREELYLRHHHLPLSQITARQFAIYEFYQRGYLELLVCFTS